MGDPVDIGAIVTNAFGGFDAVVPVVATAAIGLTLLLWGIPRAARFFKKVAS